MLKPLTGRQAATQSIAIGVCLCVCVCVCVSVRVRVCACNAVLFGYDLKCFSLSSATPYMLLPAIRTRAVLVFPACHIYHRNVMRGDRPVAVCQRGRQAAETNTDRQAAEANRETDG